MDTITVERLSKRYRVATAQAGPSGWKSRLAGLVRPTSSNGDGPRKPAVREIWALKDVSFTVERGTILGLIGRSESGKTTLLKILGRLTLPTEGRATLRGRVVSLREFTAKMVPDLSGRENLILSAGFHGFSRADVLERLDEIVAFAGAEDMIDRPVNRYLGDTYQRLAFAMATHMDADVLLVDDLVAVGNVKFQEQCLDRLAELGRMGATILIASHDLPMISRLCTRVMLMEGGRIVDDGPPQRVVGAYEKQQIEAIAKHRAKTSVASKIGTLGEVLATNLGTERGIDLRVVHASEFIDLAMLVRLKIERGYARFSFTLSTHDVVCLRLVSPELLEVTEPGLFSVIARVPAYLLAEAPYAVDAGMTVFQDGESESLVQMGGVVFEIVDEAGDEVPTSGLEAWSPRAALLNAPLWRAIPEQAGVTV